MICTRWGQARTSAGLVLGAHVPTWPLGAFHGGGATTAAVGCIASSGLPAATVRVAWGALLPIAPLIRRTGRESGRETLQWPLTGGRRLNRRPPGSGRRGSGPPSRTRPRRVVPAEIGTRISGGRLAPQPGGGRDRKGSRLERPPGEGASGTCGVPPRASEPAGGSDSGGSGLRWPGPARTSSWERLLRAGRRGPDEDNVRVSKGVQRGSPGRSRRRSGPSVRARVGQADWRASRPGGLASESARDDAADSGQVGRGERGLPPPVRQRMTRILSPGPVDHPLDRKGSGNHRAAANPLILRARARASVCVLF